jgi:putative endonuclease
MSDSRKQFGALGERLAAEMLIRRGLTLVARNWRCPLGEIDIIAQDGDVLAIIEVKARRGRSAGTPEQGVDARKQRRLCELGQCYIENVGWDGDVRIDVVGVELSSAGQLLRISYWKEAIECL